MLYQKLGRTGLDVSPICIGSMGFGEPGEGHPAWSLDEDTSRGIIRHALEAGINFFDTANLYSRGTSEAFLGRAIKDFVNRDAVVIATKLSAGMRNGPNAVGLSRKAIMIEVDNSLRRLGTDYIDLYQIHRRDQMTPSRVAQAARSATSFFVSAIAFAGFRPLGQTLAQFMIVWQRYKRNGSSSWSSRSPVASSRLSASQR